MEIILLEDVKTLGKKGDIVKVNDGYARNFILPKKLGMEATQKNLQDLKSKKEAEEKRQREILKEAQELAEKLKECIVTLRIKTGGNGKLFGSISTKEIAQAFKEQFSYDIDRKKMSISEPIKSLGTYQAVVKLHPKVSAEITLHVEGE